MNQTRLTDEYDAAARLGLEDLRACFSTNPPEGSIERAKLGLKAFAHATARMGAENSRASISLKIGAAAGMSKEELRPLFHQIAGTSPSAAVESKPPEALAPAESAA